MFVVVNVEEEKNNFRQKREGDGLYFGKVEYCWPTASEERLKAKKLFVSLPRILFCVTV